MTGADATFAPLGRTGLHLKFCPRCGSALDWRPNGGRERPHCTAEGCGYIFFGEFSIGCGGVVIRDGKALLVQRGQNPGKGSWQIPGGYVEEDEDVAEAVVRECWEEAGVRATVVDVLGFRHAIGGGVGGPSTNIYVVFRLEPEEQEEEPRCDEDEISAVGYFTLDEIEGMLRAQSLSKWSIQRALECGGGLVQAHKSFDIARPGWALFGLPLPPGVEQVPLQARPASVPAQPPESLPPSEAPTSG